MQYYDGHTITVYTDMDGRKVLERRDKSTDTYFVYNDLGQLRFVLPPIYRNSKSKNKKAITGYEYRYDGRGRLIKKILPAEPRPSPDSTGHRESHLLDDYDFMSGSFKAGFSGLEVNTTTSAKGLPTGTVERASKHQWTVWLIAYCQIMDRRSSMEKTK